MKIFFRRVAPARDEIGHVYIKWPPGKDKERERETKMKTVKIKTKTKEVKVTERDQKGLK